MSRKWATQGFKYDILLEVHNDFEDLGALIVSNNFCQWW